MATEKYIIDKSDLTALLRGEDISIQPKRNIKAFCVELAGNVTNGDMIKAMFPRYYDVEIDERYVRIYYKYFSANYPLSWWDAPYKGENEGDIKTGHWTHSAVHEAAVHEAAGYWIIDFKDTDYCFCSECKHRFNVDYLKLSWDKYEFPPCCPNCGEKLESGE